MKPCGPVRLVFKLLLQPRDSLSHLSSPRPFSSDSKERGRGCLNSDWQKEAGGVGVRSHVSRESVVVSPRNGLADWPQRNVLGRFLGGAGPSGRVEREGQGRVGPWAALLPG